MNLRRKIGSTLAACGLVMMSFGVGALPAQGAELPRVRLQPSPRPAIDPIKPQGGAGVQMGHITGTVIDLRTSSPAPGVAVGVGEAQVTTDANGNYDHWLQVGDYPVALSLASDQGQPAQGVITVTVQADLATVQHLAFTSPAPVVELPTPVAAPAPVQPVAAAPAASVSAPAPKPAVTVQGAPKHLPRTASDAGLALSWVLAGMLLLGFGLLVGFAPVINGRSAVALVRAQAANHAMLRSLLALPPVDDFLEALIERHERKTR